MPYIATHQPTGRWCAALLQRLEALVSKWSKLDDGAELDPVRELRAAIDGHATAEPDLRLALLSTRPTAKPAPARCRM